MTVHSEHTLPLRVANTGFLLDRLGQDCHPLQFLRELTRNSIEAIGRAGGEGEIRWDVDWTSYDLAEEPTYKLCVIDNGDGMTGDEMVTYLNQLSSSTSSQSMQGNYGVGAKIAAATRNHAGLIYTSWKDGHGAMIHMWRDPDSGQYGLRQFERPDGSWGHFAEIENDVRPDLIGDHGTMVVLIGNEDDDDTMRAPAGAMSPSRWISKYLNTRLFTVPEGITIRVREGWEQPRSNVDTNHLRTLVGQRRYLEQHATASGTVKLSYASAHWWILKDESAVTSNSGWIESAGHVAALYQDELYELSSGRAGRAQLQNFGIIFGTQRVAIYVEPDPSLAVTTNTARTQLLAGNEPLPWADWANEFSSKIPQPIQDLMDEVAAGSSATDHTKAIRDRLRQVFDLFKVSRYRPSAAGSVEVDTETAVRGGRPRRLQVERTAPTQRRRGGAGGAAGGIYAAFLRDGGTPADPVRTDGFPDVKWVSVADRTREVGDIEDRAARYLMQTNTLLINADFRAFTDMAAYWKKELGTTAAAGPQVDDAVRNWFEQSLVETVLGVQGLKDSKEWSIENIQSALSEESLTSAVMQRYHVNNAVKRELGAKLGRLSRLGSESEEVA